MLASAIILFREVLEAALVITIVLAATRGVTGRGWMVTGGAGAGLLGALLVAAFAEVISAAASGMGQEIFNAGILFFAAAMLGWHNVWMSRHGRELAQSMKAVGRGVAGGERPLYALAVAVGLAVLREGAEVVLFLHGIASSGQEQAAPMLAGGVLGFAAAALLGIAMYRGLMRISSRHLFTVTGWMVLLLAASMASQGAALLVQADLLPALGQAVWDTSALLPDSNVLGKLLHTLVGYTSRPYGIQLLFYLFTIATIVGLTRMVARTPAPQPA